MSRTKVNPATQSVTWKNPPPKRGGNALRTKEFVEVLKTRPNTWAIFRRNHSNAVIVSTAKTRYPDTEWTSRSDGKGNYTIYARYIGK